jgi:hypothetical protein
MSTKTHFRLGDKGENYLFSQEFETREAAQEEACDRAARSDVKVMIYQAVAEIRPERAPVSIVPLA